MAAKDFKTSYSKPPGESDQNEAEIENQNQNNQNYRYCCVNKAQNDNVWTKECLPFESKTAQLIPIEDRPKKCFSSEQACRNQCQQPLLPDLLDLVVQYQPVVMKTAFDVKDYDRDYVVAKKSNSQLEEQRNLSVRLTQLLDEWRDKYEFAFSGAMAPPALILQMVAHLHEIKRVVSLLGYAVTSQQKIYLINMYRRILRHTSKENDIYFEIVSLLQKDIEYVYEAFMIAVDGLLAWPRPEWFHNFPDIPISAYFNHLVHSDVARHFLDAVKQYIADGFQARLDPVREDLVPYTHPAIGNVIRFFPLNFSLALFEYALLNPNVTVWPWVDMIQSFLLRKDLSLQAKRLIIQRVNALRQTIVIANKTPSFEAEMKVVDWNAAIPQAWVEKLFRIYQDNQWKKYYMDFALMFTNLLALNEENSDVNHEEIKILQKEFVNAAMIEELLKQQEEKRLQQRQYREVWEEAQRERHQRHARMGRRRGGVAFFPSSIEQLPRCSVVSTLF